MDHILSSRTPFEQLKKLKTTPGSLFEAYDGVITRIKESGQEDDSGLSMIIISWIYRASRILKMSELLEAVVIEQYLGNEDSHSIEELDPILKYKMLPTDIVDLCKGLVLYEESSGLVRFSHETVKEFISERNLPLAYPSTLTKICLMYLGSNMFDNACDHEEELLTKMQKYEFSRYAGRYWADHISQDMNCEKEILNEFLAAFRFQNRRDAIEQLYMYHDVDGYIWGFKPAMRRSRLQVAASMGLATICEHLLHDASSGKDRYIQSLIHAK